MRFLLQRLLLLAPLLLAVSLVTFVMIHLVPGDPVQIYLGQNASGASLQQARHELRLDLPLPVQYLRYVGNLLHGDLGTSIRSQRPVWSEIADRLPATVQLTLAALGLAVVLGVGIGMLAAGVGSRWLGGLVVVLSAVGISLPTFALGLLLIEVFALQLHWLPVLGNTTVRGTILPAVTLAVPAGAVLARVTYAGLAEVLRQDYIRTARAKGVSRRRAIMVHALRNALVVVVTILGLQFGNLLAGAVIVENVFARPGLGTFVVGAILGRDYPAIQGTVLVLATMYVVTNLLLDLLYGVINPRIRLSA